MRSDSETASGLPEAESGLPEVIEGFVEVDTEQIPAGDIVFECPHCFKSLSIDPRGAGLVIACTACHQMVTVPIPEGMDITDLDTDSGEKEAQLANLRRLLARSESRVVELEGQIGKLREYRSTSETSRAKTARRFSELQRAAELLVQQQTELSASVMKIMGLVTTVD
jgi:hypothetical protein